MNLNLCLDHHWLVDWDHLLVIGMEVMTILEVGSKFSTPFVMLEINVYVHVLYNLEISILEGGGETITTHMRACMRLCSYF